MKKIDDYCLRMGYLFIFLFIIGTVSFANEEKIKITVVNDNGKVIEQTFMDIESFENETKAKIVVEEDGRVVTKKGDWVDVTYKVSKEKVWFDLGFILHNFKDTPKNLYSIYPRCDCLKGEWISLVVYVNNDIRGSSIYYCPQDNGVYVEDVTPTHATKHSSGRLISSGGWISKYYRIGEGRVKNDKLTISFPEGTWFSYRRKKPFFVNPKDTNWLVIHIPKDL